MFRCPYCAAVVGTRALVGKVTHHRMTLVAVSGDET